MSRHSGVLEEIEVQIRKHSIDPDPLRGPSSPRDGASSLFLVAPQSMFASEVPIERHECLLLGRKEFLATA